MTRDELKAIERVCFDSGKIIEAGWIGLQIAAVSKDAPPLQLDEMRMAFFAGAQHLFGSIMSVLEPGDEPTDKDLQRMSLIAAELERFLAEFKLKHFKTEGAA